MYHWSTPPPRRGSSMRPKKSPAPGERSDSRASATVTSTYSLVNSSAVALGSTRSSRSIILSRTVRGECEARALCGELGEADAGRHGPNTLPLATTPDSDVSARFGTTAPSGASSAASSDGTLTARRHRTAEHRTRHRGTEPPDCERADVGGRVAPAHPRTHEVVRLHVRDRRAHDGRPERLVLRAGRPERQRQVDDVAFGRRARPAR